MSKLFGLLNKALSKIKQSDWNQNDSTQPDYVKNRTHYEETTVVNEPLNITWDGNTEGLVSVSGMSFKVSDLVLTDEQLKGCTMTLSNGSIVPLSDAWDAFASSGNLVITDDCTMIGEGTILIARKAGIDINGIIIPEAGIYFGLTGLYVTSLTTTEPVEQPKTVVHKLDKKYLPGNVVMKTWESPELLGSARVEIKSPNNTVDFPIVELQDGDKVGIVFITEGEKSAGGYTYAGLGRQEVEATAKVYDNYIALYFDAVSYLECTSSASVTNLPKITTVWLNYYGDATMRVKTDGYGGFGTAHMASVGSAIPTTVKIYAFKKTEGVKTFDMVSSTYGSTKTFRIEITDEGTLTATEVT